MPNWRINAKLHKLPACPECNAFECCPCTTDRGIVREPHRVRQRIADGELFVITADQARKAGIVRRATKLARGDRAHAG